MSNETILSRVPNNTNFLQATKFSFSIPSLPFARYFCQTVLFPGISTAEVIQPTPFSAVYRHGDTLQYDQLNLTFIVDEDMRTWEESYMWLSVLTNPKRFKEYVPRFKDKYYDGILEINTNSNVPNLRIKFTSCHPISIGAVQFDSSLSADLTPICDISFRFDVFSFERIKA